MRPYTCHRCKRPLTLPAAVNGIYAYGPKCARAAGRELIRAAAKRQPAAVQRDDRTLDWVAQGVAA